MGCMVRRYTALVRSGEGASDHLSTSMAGMPQVCNINIVHHERAIVAVFRALVSVKDQHSRSMGVLHRYSDTVAHLGSSDPCSFHDARS